MLRVLNTKQALERMRKLLWTLMLAIPFPQIPNTAGWMTAERGRHGVHHAGLLRPLRAALDPLPVPGGPRDRARPGGSVMSGLWCALVAMMFVVYTVLDGFGVGVLHLFVARTDRERQDVLTAIGSSGTATRHGSSPAAARSSSPFHRRTRWGSRAALGNVLRGVPTDASGTFMAPWFTNFSVRGQAGVLHWYTLLLGLFAVVALSVHGALFLVFPNESAVRERALRAGARALAHDDGAGPRREAVGMAARAPRAGRPDRRAARSAGVHRLVP
jgi:hypothetical protein